MPHQRRTCSGLVIASNTSRRGASNRRVMRISTSDGVVTWKVSLFATRATTMCFLLRLQFQQIGLEPIEALLPDVPVGLRPLGHVLERLRMDPARPPLRLAAADDQPGPFQHAQVL